MYNGERGGGFLRYMNKYTRSSFIIFVLLIITRSIHCSPSVSPSSQKNKNHFKDFFLRVNLFLGGIDIHSSRLHLKTLFYFLLSNQFFCSENVPQLLPCSLFHSPPLFQAPLVDGLYNFTKRKKKKKKKGEKKTFSDSFFKMRPWYLSPLCLVEEERPQQQQQQPATIYIFFSSPKANSK
jgi:hypothetical protein